jgi:hypothetical protein
MGDPGGADPIEHLASDGSLINPTRHRRAADGMLGGHALSGRGPRWARIVSGAVAGTAVPVWALTVTSFAGPGYALDTPRGAWVAISWWSFLAVLMLACAIPHRAVTPQHAA